MNYFFNPKDLNILKSFSVVNTLFAFDFDGTLAPIVSNPDDAALSNKTAELMKELNKLVPIAIITGRSLKDIKKLLPFQPKYLIGNHGMEGMQDAAELERIKGNCRNWLKLLTEFLGPYFHSMGMSIEDKTYSLTIHYRNSSDAEVAEKIAFELLSKLPGAKITGGKCVLNVLPDDSINKGQALNRLMRDNGYDFGFFIGDDVTDEDVFSYRDPRLLTVRVGNSPTSKAKFYIHDQLEIEELLTHILNFRVNALSV